MPRASALPLSRMKMLTFSILPTGRFHSLPMLLAAFWIGLVLSLTALNCAGQDLQTEKQFLRDHCNDCHRSPDAQGGFDIEQVSNQLSDAKGFALWVKIVQRVQSGEMPPRNSEPLAPSESKPFVERLASRLVAIDDARSLAEGRATQRRMNRYEYENTLRDLLDAPWLQIKSMLPEDGEAFRFNKVGDALDVSHVQIARYLAAADYALREVTYAPKVSAEKLTSTRYYARDSRAFYRKIHYTVFNRSPERATFPILGFEADTKVLDEKSPVSVGAEDPQQRELEAMGVVASTYEPLEIKFDQFKAPQAGRYKLRFSAYSFWAGPESDEKWWRPSRKDVSKGRSREPVSVYAETPPRLLRKIGNFEVNPEPGVYEMEAFLLEGETIRPDAVRLFRSRPPGPWRNPLAEKDGQPGVAFRWLEVEGPLATNDVSNGYKLLFDELPIKTHAGKLRVVSEQPRADSLRLLKRFIDRVYRQPADDADIAQFSKVIEHAIDSRYSFDEAMIAGYSAVLCSPKFVTLAEAPGPLNDFAIATRLSYFLWNSEPDVELRRLASENKLHDLTILRGQVNRMLNDPKSQRFVDAFLDYWLDLRKSEATSPDAELYPDYYLDDYLVESSVDESRAFFAELIKDDLPARNIIDSDFVMINERLAKHYAINGVEGYQIRRVNLEPDHLRGGVLTQASVLKITANGTTTSPVLRGAWMTERILGKPVPPPPAAVPAVEPDTRGATTIREQLAKHRSQESCNACHARIDPPGFALECFDILGGYRENYRILTVETVPDKQKLEAPGFGKNGQPFTFKNGPKIDASGELLDGRKFADLRELQKHLLRDQRQIARNIAQQLLIYATGAPVRFGDYPEIELILDNAEAQEFGIRTIVTEIVASELFRNK